ncbi:hypothetical protein [Flindersiella endophytica]
MLGWFTAGLLLGGTLSATVLWLLSGLLQPVPELWRHAAVVVLAILGVLRELGVVRIRLPQNARQIAREVLQRNVLRGALQFGFELGTGVRTFVSATAPYVVAFAILLAGLGFGSALAIGLGFGLGRALTTWSRYFARDSTSWDRMLAERIRLVTVGTGLAIAGLCGVLILF